MSAVIAPRDDAVKRLPRDAELGRRFHYGKSERGQNILAQDFAGMHRRQRALRAMVISSFPPDSRL
jgi:hypothetical protein